ncbi:MAG: hypothetical protein ACO1QS_02755 [Verrucomicrobiota bacterium]
MKILLFVLLGFLVALIIAVLVLRMVLRKVVSKVAEGIKQIANDMPPPFRLKLTPVEDPEWLEQPEVKKRLDALKACGFQVVGAYEMEEAFDSFTVGLVQPETNVLGAVHWLKQNACIDLVSYYGDGTTLTYCDNPHGASFGRPAQHALVRMVGSPPDAIYQRLLAERRPDAMPVTAADFVPRLEKAYNESMDWQAERGGYTLEEIRTEALRGSPDAEPQAIEDVHQRFAGYALTNWLSLQSNRPEPWDEKELGLIIVHDDLTMRQVTNLFNEQLDDEVAEADVTGAGATPREAFAALNAKLGGKFVKVGEKTTPRAADFYESAPDPDEEKEAEEN